MRRFSAWGWGQRLCAGGMGAKSDDIVMLSDLDDYGDDENIAPHVRSRPVSRGQKKHVMLSNAKASSLSAEDGSRPATAGSDMDFLEIGDDVRPSPPRRVTGGQTAPEIFVLPTHSEEVPEGHEASPEDSDDLNIPQIHSRPGTSSMPAGRRGNGDQDASKDKGSCSIQ